MKGVPVRTAEDALAALDFILEDSNGWVSNFKKDSVHGSLMRSVRDYIAAGRIS